MATCPKCGKELEDGTRFCDNCGARIIETIFCPNCGEQTSSEFAFCQKCGASLNPEAPVIPNTPTAPEAPKKALPKGLFLVGGIVVAAVAVIAVVMSMFSGGGGGGKSSKNVALYIKDKQIVYNDFSKAGAREITTRLVDGDLTNERLAGSSQYVGYMVTFSKDGKRVFFPDRIDPNDAGITLYCLELNKKNAEAIRIDSGVTGYAINDAGDNVFYLKDSVLYRHDLKDKTKIASDVSSFLPTDDGKKMLYETEDAIYLWQPSKDNSKGEKVASDIDSVVFWKDDLSVIYYTKEDTLYKQEIGKDREKIASDITGYTKVYESGEAYYVKSEDIEIKLMDYVNDELKSSDASMTEPVWPSTPDLLHFSSFYTWWENYSTDNWRYIAQQLLDTGNYTQNEYNDTISKIEQYEQATQQYSIDSAAYQEKLQRDSMRRSLESATMSRTQYTLYYFDGKESSKVTDALTGLYTGDWASDSAVGVVRLYDQKEVRNVKLSDISNVYEVQNQVEEALYANSQLYVAVGGSLTELDAEDSQSLQVSGDGKAIYYLDDVNREKGRGDLYKIVISGKEVGKPEMYDSDVSTYSAISIFDNGSVAYFKDVDSSSYKGDLYLDKKAVDYDVYLYLLERQESGTLTYYTDWNNEKTYGTLKMYKGEKAEKVADDANMHTVLPDGSVLYLYDYSTNSYKGDLYQYKNSKAEKIDEDVVALLRVNETNRAG